MNKYKKEELKRGKKFKAESCENIYTDEEWAKLLESYECKGLGLSEDAKEHFKKSQERIEKLAKKLSNR